jgi:hypothetical protein
MQKWRSIRKNIGFFFCPVKSEMANRMDHGEGIRSV